MRVGFFYQNNGAVSNGIAEVARHMIRSIHDSMPGVEVWQLSDGDTELLDGVTGVKRLPDPMPMAVRRVALHSQCDGDWLFIDTDVVVRKDVRDVFKEAFDVAITDRSGTITYESAYAKVMPYNIGVVFSRSPAFWQAVHDYLVQYPIHMQHWEGDQRVVAGIMAHRNRLGFNVKILPGLKFNYPPQSADDPRIQEASIVHFKGSRKKYLEAA